MRRIVRVVMTAAVSASCAVSWGIAFGDDNPAPADQYKHGDIAVPAATDNEPTRRELSVKHAADYLEQGALAWTRERKCVSCHTNGSYMQAVPALTPWLGPPSEEIRTFFITTMRSLKEQDRETLLAGIRPTQIAYVASGLAEWDAHVAGQLSPETDEALRLMFSVQAESGEWGNTDCWPPFESSSYHGTTVAAMAAATAPGWLANLTDEKLLAGVEKMKNHLRTTAPPNDYDQLLLLWTSTRLPGLIDETQKAEFVENVWKQQREDGGWSIRTFSTPEAWGSGNRAEKLRNEPEFANPPSDGHQTGLAVLVLRDAGVPADEPRIQKAVKWLLTHQRQSGRWWTRSLNTDGPHYITYSGTTFPLLALAKCNALPKLEERTAGR